MQPTFPPLGFLFNTKRRRRGGAAHPPPPGITDGLFLYSAFGLNADWQQGDAGNQILIATGDDLSNAAQFGVTADPFALDWPSIANVGADPFVTSWSDQSGAAADASNAADARCPRINVAGMSLDYALGDHQYLMSSPAGVAAINQITGFLVFKVAAGADGILTLLNYGEAGSSGFNAKVWANGGFGGTDYIDVEQVWNEGGIARRNTTATLNATVTRDEWHLLSFTLDRTLGAGGGDSALWAQQTRVWFDQVELTSKPNNVDQNAQPFDAGDLYLGTSYNMPGGTFRPHNGSLNEAWGLAIQDDVARLAYETQLMTAYTIPA